MKSLLPYLFITLFAFFNVDAQTYEVVQTLIGHEGAVQNLRFSPSGQHLASGGLEDFKVMVWETSTGKLLHKLSGHTDGISEVTFSPDGQLLASAGKNGAVIVWSHKKGQLMGVYHTPPKMSMMGEVLKSAVFTCFSPDSKTLYFGGSSGDIYHVPLGVNASGMYYRPTVLSNANPSELALSQITGGAITPDGKGVMVSIDKLVRIFDLKTGALLRNFYYPYDYLNDVVVAPNQQIATWSYDGFVTVWDYASAKIVKRLQVSTPKTYSAASFSPDGNYLSTGAFGSNARVWKWKEEKHIANLSGHSRIVRMTRFHPNQHLIASASYDGTIKLWKMAEGKDLTERGTEERAIVLPTENIITEKKTEKEALPIDGTIARPSLTEKELVVGKSIEMKNIQFAQASYELTPQAKIDLDAVLALMKKHASMVIEIHGHTDNIGRTDLNMKLSERRAIVSRNYLINHGISEDRIGVKAFGGTQPITDTRGDNRRNRRIEVLIVRI